LADALKEVLRHDVIYITVDQLDDGFPGDNDLFRQIQDEYNIVIMSAGGYGHVTVPLLKQPEELVPKIPVENRKHFISYVGSETNAPYDLRRNVISLIGRDHYYKGEGWRSVMQDSKFSLTPRGYGRTSYHVMEILQMGLIPIHVYSDGDIPWLPYSDTILLDLSFSTDLENLPKLIKELEDMPDSQIEQMEQRIEKLIPEYFTFEGVMLQIEKFLLPNSQEQSALTCRPLPEHPGTAIPKWFTPK